MKRLLALFLCLAMIFSMVSCASSLVMEETKEETKESENTVLTEETETQKEEEGPITLPQGFSVGYGRADVTPAAGTTLSGYGVESNRKRLSQRVLDPLMLTCTAVSDGENVVLLFSTDNLYTSEDLLNQVENLIKKIYPVPRENIMLNATHTHSSVPVYYTGFTGETAYRQKYYAAVRKVVEDALRDLESAEIYIGSANTENLNYVRRYVNLADGSFAGKNLYDADPAKIGHETQSDTQMQVVKFDRATKKDVVLVNWQCHVTGPGAEDGTDVSADWVGTFRKYMEEDGDLLFAYHQGAAGNIAASSGIKGEPANKDWYEHGKKLTAVAKSAMENMTLVSSGKLQVKMTTMTANLNPLYKPEGGSKSFLVSVITMGDVAFAATPYEMHDTNGMELKAASPFKMTFMCAYTNGNHGYMASSAAFENGGYEVESSHFEKGTGEAAVAQLVSDLNTLYQTR